MTHLVEATNINDASRNNDAIVIVGGSECNSAGFSKIFSLINDFEDLFPKNADVTIRRGITCLDIPSNAYMVISKDPFYDGDPSDDEACITRVFEVKDDGGEDTEGKE